MIVVELIFIAGAGAMLYGAFWCGAKYGTLAKLFERIKQSWA